MVLDPQTCATFEMMHHFHAHNLQGKISAFDYYASLKLLTDATSLAKIPDHLSSFMVMAVKWAGHAHDISGIKSTAPGSIAILCHEKDPSLGPGYAYFLASDKYLTHLANYINEDEISHCVSFAAMWAANKKKSKGLHATGIGSVSCARHQLFQRMGTGDL
ncbi:hypothetical protein H0H92_012149 [Tricholoma furcatifolium]|nr:hypothetical protein H0H92_012149 [Tricholoma furcatifolium]